MLQVAMPAMCAKVSRNVAIITEEGLRSATMSMGWILEILNPSLWDMWASPQGDLSQLTEDFASLAARRNERRLL